MARSSDSDENAKRDDEEEGSSPDPREIRLAKVSVTRTGHGVAMDIMAGKLRLRLYIDAQWSDLVRTIAAGKGELDQFIPFRMAPVNVQEDTDQVTPETLKARPIPELSSDHPLFGTPLWEAIFPSGEPPSPEFKLDFERKPSSSEDSEEDST